jgi:hypothetical protein
MRKALGCLPYISVFKTTSPNSSFHHWWEPRFTYLLKNIAWCLLPGRRIFWLGPNINGTQAFHTIKNISKPRAPTDIKIKTHITVRKYIQTSAPLVPD